MKGIKGMQHRGLHVALCGLTLFPLAITIWKCGKDSP